MIFSITTEEQTKLTNFLNNIKHLGSDRWYFSKQYIVRMEGKTTEDNEGFHIKDFSRRKDFCSIEEARILFEENKNEL